VVGRREGRQSLVPRLWADVEVRSGERWGCGRVSTPPPTRPLTRRPSPRRWWCKPASHGGESANLGRSPPAPRRSRPRPPPRLKRRSVPRASRAAGGATGDQVEDHRRDHDLTVEHTDIRTPAIRATRRSDRLIAWGMDGGHGTWGYRPLVNAPITRPSPPTSRTRTSSARGGAPGRSLGARRSTHVTSRFTPRPLPGRCTGALPRRGLRVLPDAETFVETA
jgi:hypothetical protein